MTHFRDSALDTRMLGMIPMVISIAAVGNGPSIFIRVF